MEPPLMPSLMPPRPILDPRGPYSRPPLKPHQLTAPVTPTQDLFVLAHFGVARVEPETWSLAIDGPVRRPRSYTLDELERHPTREIQAVHKCVGSPLALRVPTRRVANVAWGGVELPTLLDDVGVEESARYVWSYGLDDGAFPPGAGPSKAAYRKDLTLERVDAGDALVAYELNGEPLPAEPGFPVRLVVPGWYGTNRGKWLYRLTLAERRADGPFTTTLTTFYNDVLPGADGDGTPRTRPVWDVEPESVIVAPASEERLEAGRPVEIWGRAWAAKGIAAVGVSLDGGRTWHSATVEAREQWSWQRFSYTWRPAEAGVVTIACRATDLGGATQPLTGARNEIHAVDVTVTA
jgi:DMSO/TMAO reductase YedYZ molybdopterin-dependent catalytic subunit